MDNYEIVIKDDGIAYIYLEGEFQFKVKKITYLHEAIPGWDKVETSIE